MRCTLLWFKEKGRGKWQGSRGGNWGGEKKWSGEWEEGKRSWRKKCPKWNSFLIGK